jgi:two-component sensor histidine kinase/PAS domain-containing protein
MVDSAPLLRAPRTVGLVIFGLSVVAALGVLITGALAIDANREQQQLTANLYQHPFAVSNAALDARLAASRIRSQMLYLVVSRDLALVESTRVETEALDALITNRLELVGRAYLGDVGQVREAQALVRQWREARALVFDQLHRQDFDGARGVVLETASPLHDQVAERLDTVLAFARDKARSLADQAALQNARTQTNLRWSFCGLAVVFIALGVSIGRVVTARLRERDDALLLQDAVFRLALEASPVGMLVLDATGAIDLVNGQVEQLFGYQRAELYRAGLALLLPDGLREGEHTSKHHDGSARVVDVGVVPLQTPRGPSTLCSIVDVTEQRRATRRLEASLEEKETLVREVHHRVKNNLQVISSLLSVQSSFVADPQTRDLLEASRARVHSIALVHEMLYQEADLGQVDVGEYLASLVKHVVSSIGGAAHGGPRVTVEASGLTLPIDRAIPLGLVVNELVTNSLKHAFELTERGHVTVTLRADDPTHLTLEVADDGRGLPSPTGHERASMGLKLVSTLARQLNGELRVAPAGARGTSTTLRFEARE